MNVVWSSKKKMKNKIHVSPHNKTPQIEGFYYAI